MNIYSWIAFENAVGSLLSDSHRRLQLNVCCERLTNYRVFQENTTSWCPDREEHGYYLTPIFKCSTSPRTTTAHRWSAVDISTRLNKPTGDLYILRLQMKCLL